MAAWGLVGAESLRWHLLACITILRCLGIRAHRTATTDRKHPFLMTQGDLCITPLPMCRKQTVAACEKGQCDEEAGVMKLSGGAEGVTGRTACS